MHKTTLAVLEAMRHVWSAPVVSTVVATLSKKAQFGSRGLLVSDSDLYEMTRRHRDALFTAQWRTCSARSG